MQPEMTRNKDLSRAEIASVWDAMMWQFHEHARAEISFAKQLPGMACFYSRPISSKTSLLLVLFMFLLAIVCWLFNVQFTFINVSIRTYIISAILSEYSTCRLPDAAAGDGADAAHTERDGASLCFCNHSDIVQVYILYLAYTSHHFLSLSATLCSTALTQNYCTVLSSTHRRTRIRVRKGMYRYVCVCVQYSDFSRILNLE